MDFFCSSKDSFIEPRDLLERTLQLRNMKPEDLKLRETVIFSFIPEITKSLNKQLGVVEAEGFPLLREKFYNPPSPLYPFSIFGSAVGAPYAVMLMEQLIVLGAKNFYFIGFCGGIGKEVRIGDLIIPTEVVREEGTSYHYFPGHVKVEGDGQLVEQVQNITGQLGRRAITGPLWTTDALYRETMVKIERFRERGVLGVDMETSAVYAIAKYRRVKAVALHVVSDLVGREKWQTSFGWKALIDSSKMACNILIKACQESA
ncbi:MAG: nucleoside phosphorylase [Candidatus Tectomicrobia bacterium]|uniref:Nucleoside phosphorylase n=1 Tax=Tectimicrobiota bacterium TaxID=2528274 RepID=A0A933GQE1_UNCTE|nr:nucleoside phosphorylase [Candidatus Tectomicrobia bacterium]